MLNLCTGKLYVGVLSQWLRVSSSKGLLSFQLFSGSGVKTRDLTP